MSEPDKKSNHSATELFSRVNHLERDTSSIKTEISGLNVVISDVKATLNRVVEMLSLTQRTPWQTILMFAGLLISSIGGIWALGMSPMKEQVRILTEQNLKQAEVNGYQKAQLEFLIKEIEK